MDLKNPLVLLRPTQWVGAVTDIRSGELTERGIKGIVLDLDETLVSALDRIPHPRVIAWLEEMKREFRLYIVSNNYSAARVASVADEIGIPSICRALKPRRSGFRQALEAMELAPEQVAIVGDQLFTDVLGGNRLGAMTILVTPIAPERKPWRKLMRLVEGMLIREYDHLRSPSTQETVWGSRPDVQETKE